VSPRGQTPNEREIAGQIRAPYDFIVTLPYGQDVKPKDRIVIGTRTFEVQGIAARSWEISRRVHCTELQV
jgi:hypothetical protein